MRPIDALVAATLAPARFIERDENPSFGVIAPGKRADLLLVDGDPTADIEAVSSIREVVHRGVVLERTPVGG